MTLCAKCQIDYQNADFRSQIKWDARECPECEKATADSVNSMTRAEMLEEAIQSIISECNGRCLGGSECSCTTLIARFKKWKQELLSNPND